MKTVMIVAAALALSACYEKPAAEPVEEFTQKFCTAARTGVTGVRKWEQCHQVGKMACGSKTQHQAETEQWKISCAKLIVQDKSVAKMPAEVAK